MHYRNENLVAEVLLESLNMVVGMLWTHHFVWVEPAQKGLLYGPQFRGSEGGLVFGPYKGPWPSKWGVYIQRDQRRVNL